MQPDQNIPPVQPATPVTPVQALPVVPPTQPYPTTQLDPGKTLGIVGLCLNIITPIAAIIVSVISYRKSKKAGFNGKLGRIGIIVGIILLVLSIIFSVIYFTLVIPAVNNATSTTSQAETAIDNALTTEKNALAVSDIAGSFGITNQYYPSTVADFSKPPKDNSTSDVSSLPTGVTVSGTNPTAANGTTVIGYQYTVDPTTSTVNGGRVVWWDYRTGQLTTQPYYVGRATADSTFLPIK